MKLKRPLPPNRSFEQLLNHYQVEKYLANKLKSSNRKERKTILNSMYDELFKKVPDHPRLTRRESEQLININNKNKLSFIKRFLFQSAVFVEFGPGDCKFASEIAKNVKEIIGIDISDQRSPNEVFPDNFQLIVYDGYNLDQIKDNSIDVVFSDQLIEHFHPEDTKLHFESVRRILTKGGKYVFRTPLSITGPHDISRYFSDEAEGFHLKEWSYLEINRLLKDLGYSDFKTYWNKRNWGCRLPYIYFELCERFLGQFPKKYTQIPAQYFIPSLVGSAIK